jgi:UDP:flavonoid glycosyltransferase YjiC (YdhE family)
VRDSLRRLLSEPSFTQAAGDLAGVFRKHDAAASFRTFLDATLGQPKRVAGNDYWANGPM